MKYWEIIADKLSKAGWSWRCVSAVDSNGQTVLSLPRIATESVSLCAQMKSWLRFWKSNQRFAERA
jgi:hypothetical protein